MHSLYVPPLVPSIYLPEPQTYSKTEYLITKMGNRISTSSALRGSDKIIVAGRTTIHPGTELHAEHAQIMIGKYCVFHSAVVLHTPEHVVKGSMEHLPVQVGDYVVVGQGTISSAAQIGSYVKIGSNCVLKPLCIIYDCAMLLDNTVLEAGAIVPPFTVFGGNPGKFVGKLYESWPDDWKEEAHNYYYTFTCIE